MIIEPFPPLTQPLPRIQSPTSAADEAKGSLPWVSGLRKPTPDFAAALLTAPQLVGLAVEPRPALLGAWMRQGDLGYLFAPRGVGKSWLAMLIANAVVESLPLGDWAAGETPCPVYYFDAEMNLPDLRERAVKCGITSPNFHWLSNEHLFGLCNQGVNIAAPDHQQALSAMLPESSFFIIDNLSTAQMGMDENDNDAFDLIRDWLLSLRHRRITVLIVHHAGRSGLMRGASRREDMAHWILSLKDARGEGQAETQFTTVFTTCFAKLRNCSLSQAPALKWTVRDEGERCRVICEPNSGLSIMLGHIREGVTRANDLALMLDVQPGTISKWAKRLEAQGLITVRNREYHLAGEEAQPRFSFPPQG